MLKETTIQSEHIDSDHKSIPTGRRMNAQALAEFLNWKTQTVRRRVCEGLPMPPSVKVGNRRWWIESDVIFWEIAHKAWALTGTDPLLLIGTNPPNAQ